MSRWERLNLRVVRHIPTPILASPEQILINAACVLIGIDALIVVRPDSVISHWPRWAAVEWALGMAVGGVAALVGIWRGRRPVARLGFLLIAVCCCIYAVSLLAVFGPRVLTSALIFLGIAAAKAVRLMAGSAHRAEVIRAGRVTGDL